MDTNFLKIPLYKLNYIDNLEDFQGIDTEEWTHAEKIYTESEFLNIIDALRWGQANPSFDFSSLDPDLPYNNEQIHKYICTVYQSFKEFQATKQLRQFKRYKYCK